MSEKLNPYESPSYSDIVAFRGGLVDTSFVAKYCSLCLIVVSILASVLAVNYFTMVNLGDDQSMRRSIIAGAPKWITFLQFFMILSCVVTAIFFLIWKYKSCHNARLLHKSNKARNYSPFEACVWYIVPICGLWMPYLVMRYICRASILVDQGSAGVRKCWWIFWILGCLPLLMIALPTSGHDVYRFATYQISWVGCVFISMASVCLGKIINQVTTSQTEECDKTIRSKV